jgi:threonine/homoserine/homoserine lactone efflux protein
VAAIGDFFNRLTQPNTWIRVGEVIGGLLLVYVGLRATTSGTEAAEIGRGVKSAAKPVKAVAKATPAGRGLAVERRARKIAKRRSIESAAGRRATVIKQKKAS